MVNDWLERNRILVLVIVGLAVAGAAALFALRYRPPEPIVIQPPSPTVTPGPIQIYVSGAVASPDVYTLPPGSIVRDAIELAGGASADANLDGVNLAAELANGEQVYVPVIGEAAPPVQGDASGGGVAPQGPVNINTADADTLQTLPGIGPALAERIIAYREENGQFGNIQDLQNVSGIGPSTFEQLADLITVGAP